MSLDLCTRKRTIHGLSLWWICQIVNGKAVPYSDVCAPTGYGFTSHAKADRCARELEQESVEQGNMRKQRSIR